MTFFRDKVPGQDALQARQFRGKNPWAKTPCDIFGTESPGRDALKNSLKIDLGAPDGRGISLEMVDPISHCENTHGTGHFEVFRGVNPEA